MIIDPLTGKPQYDYVQEILKIEFEKLLANEADALEEHKQSVRRLENIRNALKDFEKQGFYK